MNNIILSICIPTYNRSSFLNRLFDSIKEQISEFSSSIEIIISDNASTDSTKDYCNQLVADFEYITYVRNKTNLGPDKNISNVFKMARGKYVWVLGDDELLAPNALVRLVSLLDQIEIDTDMLYLSSIPTTVIKQNNIDNKLELERFDNNIDFAKRVGILFTFISGVIVNKAKLGNIEEEINFNLGTYLVQLSWVYSALKEGNKFLYIKTPLFMTEPNNSGGYNLFEVFITNFLKITRVYFDEPVLLRFMLLESLLFSVRFYINRKENIGFVINNDILELADKNFSDLPIYKYYFRWIFVLKSNNTKYLIMLPYKVISKIKSCLS